MVGFIYFGFKKRSFDAFSLAYFASMIYFLPGFFGFVMNQYGKGKMPESLTDKTYVIYIIFQMSILFGAFFYDLVISRMALPQKRIVLKEDHILETILLLVTIFCLLSVFGNYSSYFDPNKQIGLEKVDRYFIFFEYVSVFGFILSVLRKRQYYIIFFLIFLLLIAFIGFRLPLVMAFASSMLYILNRQGGVRLFVKNWFFVLGGILFVICLFIYKKLYIGLKSGSFEVLNRLLEKDIYLNAIIRSEPFTTQAYLNNVFLYDFKINDSYYLINAIYSSLPFGNLIATHNIENFNDLSQYYLFPNVKAGLAANIFAEICANFGLYHIITFSFAFIAMIFVFNFFIKRIEGLLLVPVLMITFLNVAYLHRNEIFSLVGFDKRVLMTFVIILCFSFCFKVLKYFSPRLKC